MRRCYDSYLFPGAFAPTLSLDALGAGLDDGAGLVAFDLTDPEPLADAVVEREEALQAIKYFVASLPARDRAIAVGVFWHQQTQTEIAARFGVSKMAISKAMARICKRGREALAMHENLALAN
jgi:RNA polymerase sigma-B factor